MIGKPLWRLSRSKGQSFGRSKRFKVALFGIFFIGIMFISLFRSNKFLLS